jgi:hypothetical protein
MNEQPATGVGPDRIDIAYERMRAGSLRSRRWAESERKSSD